MVKTGNVAVIGTNARSAHDWQARHTGLRWRLLSGLSAVTLLAALTFPVTIDSTTLLPSLASAMAADNGNGDGQGKGKGNGKGRGDEYGNGQGPGGGNGRDGDDDDDHGHDDDDDDDDAGGGDPGNDDANDDEHAGGSNDGNPGEFGAIEDSAFADAVEDVATLPDQAAPASAPAMPTIREVFALGDESVLNAEQELLAIQNGWKSQN